MTASVWGPFTLVLWQRRANHLLFEWRMKEPDSDCQLEKEGTCRDAVCFVYTCWRLIDLSLLAGTKSNSKYVNIHHDAEQATNPELGGKLVWVLGTALAFVVSSEYDLGMWKSMVATGLLIWLVKPQRFRLGAKWKLFLFVLPLGACMVIIGFVTVLAGNFLLIEYSQYLTTLPLCGTYFHSISEIHNVYTAGGLFSSNSSVLPLGPDCYHEISQQMWGGPRGIRIFSVGIVAALLIDVIYDTLFRSAADVVLEMLNIKMQVDYDSARVAIYFPFMWSGFMSYFLLAAALVPFGPYIDPLLLQYIHWLTEIKIQTVGTFNNLKTAVTDIDHLKAFVGESLHDLGLGGNHTDTSSLCVSNTTFGGEAGGPQPETSCVFPFDYCDQGSGDCVAYSACTAHESLIVGQPWCATRPTAEGGWEDNNWGYCDCGGQQAGGLIEGELDPARIDNLMSYWRYNHRISITLDGQMIGPLVVAVGLDFVFKNLIPFCEYHRRNFLALRRGRRIGCCARIMLSITCCFAGTDHNQQGVLGDRELSEAIGEDGVLSEEYIGADLEQRIELRKIYETQINEARAQFADRLQQRLESMTDVHAMVMEAQDEEGSLQASPRSAPVRKKLLVVSSLRTTEFLVERDESVLVESLQCCKKPPPSSARCCSGCSSCSFCTFWSVVYVKMKILQWLFNRK